jgi:hypothetical protein
MISPNMIHSLDAKIHNESRITLLFLMHAQWLANDAHDDIDVLAGRYDAMHTYYFDQLRSTL